jgi:hypothetical protein
MRRTATVACLFGAVVAGCGNSARIDSVKEGMTQREVRKIMGHPEHIEYGCWLWGDFSSDLPKATAAICFTDSHVAYVMGSHSK